MKTSAGEKATLLSEVLVKFSSRFWKKIGLVVGQLQQKIIGKNTEISTSLFSFKKD